MKYIAFPILLLFFISSCKKNTPSNGGCIIPADVPFQPYSDPVWHPNGKLLGFNYTPLAGITQSGVPPCTWYYYSPNQDSAGFYLMNEDGTAFRRVTNFLVYDPAWSPDGKWLAFSNGSIYKMQFDGTTFDTANIIRLTDSAASFFPSWTANSDSIYFDSNAGTNGQGYYVWKMASDGSGKIGFPNTGREPNVGSDNRIYYSGLYDEVFSMNKDGTNQTQLTSNGTGDRPKFWQGKVFHFGGSRFVPAVGGTDIQINSKAGTTFDISVNGEIVYSPMDWKITDYNKQLGTLWIMNSDGSNNRQLTFNKF